MSGLIVTVLALVNLTNAWWSGLGPALLALTVSALASPYVGHQQGAGFAHRQFAYSIVGGGMMLALTYFLVKSETWTNSPYSAKTLSLSLVLFVGSCLPLIFVVLKSRREIVFSKSAEPTNSRSLWVALFEIASLLPPAMLGAFDVFALSTYAGQGELSTYGYISRLVLITTVVPSALNAQISNFANRLNSRSKEVWLPLLFLEIATIPGVCILLFVGVDLVRLLSGGTVEVPFYHLLPTALSAFLIPIWVLLSQMVSSKVDARLDLGRSILLYLLPVEVAATFILGASWGSLGVFSATTLGYGLACLIAVRKLRKMERT
jgi:hypothetical protein